jgi:hypothetical protein
MRYRKLDENGDMLFGNQQGDFHIDNPEAVGQSVLTRLKLWQGEWFLNTDEGTPFEQSALGTNKMKTIDPAIRKRILESEGVESLDSFELLWDSDSRHVNINATITTVYGEQEILGVL